MATKKTSHKGKGSYAVYRSKNKYAINKERKLIKHLKKCPNDNTAKKCLEIGRSEGFSWKRNIPKTREWSSTDKHFAKVWKDFGHSGKEYQELMKIRRKGT